MASVLLPRDSEPGPDTGECSIIVLYDDSSSRDAAIRLCNSLEKTFQAELDFEITWCRFKYFLDTAIASDAAEIAAHADLILVATHRPQDLPLEVMAWFELWLPNRGSPEAALVLLQTSDEPSPSANSHSSYLYLLAQRASLDFISLSNGGTSLPTTRVPEKPFLSQPLDLDPTHNSQQYSRSGINE